MNTNMTGFRNFLTFLGSCALNKSIFSIEMVNISITLLLNISWGLPSALRKSGPNIGIHLIIFSRSFQMNTNMTGFRNFLTFLVLKWLTSPLHCC